MQYFWPYPNSDFDWLKSKVRLWFTKFIRFSLLPNPIKKTQWTKPNLLKQICSLGTKQNIPNKICQTKSIEPKLRNRIYKIKSAKQNVLNVREAYKLKNVTKSGKSPQFSWPPPLSPRMFWTFLRLGKCGIWRPPLDLIWDKFEISKILNFRNPPSTKKHKLINT